MRKIKKTVSCMLTMFILLSSMMVFTVNASANVSSGQCGDNVTWSLSEDGVLTISGTGEIYDNSEYEKMPWSDLDFTRIVIEGGITKIGSHTFTTHHKVIESLTICEGVEVIGEGAFSDCFELLHVDLPASLITIGDKAFSDCYKLEGMSIPKNIRSIGNHAFLSNYKLNALHLPKSVTEIGGAAFGECKALTSITIDEENPVFSVSDGVLFNKDMSALVTYPAGKAGDYIIPNSVKDIEYGAFIGASDLTSVVIPDSVQTIKSRAFRGCTSLSELTIPGSVEVISDSFDSCYNLEYLTVSEGVKVIERHAFFRCYALKTVNLPSTIEKIGDAAFMTASYKYGTPDFKDICFNGSEKLWSSVEYEKDNAVGDNTFDEGDRFHFAYLAGDINGDNIINLKDSNLMKRIVLRNFEPNNTQLAAGDLDNDGRITTKDVYLLKRLRLS